LKRNPSKSILVNLADVHSRLTEMRTFVVVAALLGAVIGSFGCQQDPTATAAPTSPAVPTQPPATVVARPEEVTKSSEEVTKSSEEVTKSSETPRATTVAPAPSPTGAATITASATQTLQPTNSPRPTRTTRPTRTPTQTPTLWPGSGPIGGPDFPPDVNPLTGLKVSDPAVLERAPLAIKVSNAPPSVRPQAGLDKADLIFEHYAEGGVTRLTAVFLGQTPTMVGSVRSGRLIDLEIPAMFKALFAFSGTSAGVAETYRKSDLWPDQLARPGTAGGAFYRRDLPKAWEHTLFINPITLWEEAERRGLNERKDLRGMSFNNNPPSGGAAAEEVSILYRAAQNHVQWVYDRSQKRFYRWQGGTPHTEEISGSQLSAANVIVVSANHVETTIVEDTWGGGHWSIEVQIWGEGPVSIFRDGLTYDGIWRRYDRHEPLSFWTQDGTQRIPLKPGNSWLQMVPLGFTGLEVSP
jgi:hypothetical protein